MLMQLRGDRLKPGACVTERQAGPSREILILRGAMPGQVTAGKFRERDVTIHRRRFTEPIPHEDKRVLPARHWTAHDQPANRRERQEMYECLSLRADAGGRDHIAEAITVERAFFR